MGSVACPTPSAWAAVFSSPSGGDQRGRQPAGSSIFPAGIAVRLSGASTIRDVALSAAPSVSVKRSGARASGSLMMTTMTTRTATVVTTTATSQPTCGDAPGVGPTSSSGTTGGSAAEGSAQNRPARESVCGQCVDTSARRDWRRDPIVAITALGSYPQWAMQLAQRSSLPLP
jgi:hypothetical protein